PAELAAVLERMRQIDEVRLGGVVEQRPEHVLAAPAPLLDEVGDEARVLGNGVEDTAVAAEPALVRERAGDVLDVDVGRIGRERVEAPPADGLDVRPGLHASERTRCLRAAVRGYLPRAEEADGRRSPRRGR